jgi:hypothetical protein
MGCEAEGRAKNFGGVFFAVRPDAVRSFATSTFFISKSIPEIKFLVVKLFENRK